MCLSFKVIKEPTRKYSKLETWLFPSNALQMKEVERNQALLIMRLSALCRSRCIVLFSHCKVGNLRLKPVLLTGTSESSFLRVDNVACKWYPRCLLKRVSAAPWSPKALMTLYYMCSKTRMNGWMDREREINRSSQIHFPGYNIYDFRDSQDAIHAPCQGITLDVYICCILIICFHLFDLLAALLISF